MSQAAAHLEAGKRRMASLQRLMALEHFTRARELCAEAGDTDGELRAMHWLARSLDEAGRPKEALPLWEEAVERGTRDPEVLDFLIGRYTRSGQHEDALRIWTIRKERLPEGSSSATEGTAPGAAVLTEVAESLFVTGLEGEADATYKRIREEEARRGHPTAWVWEKKARLLLRLERPVDALVTLLEGFEALGAEGVRDRRAAALVAQAERAARLAGLERPVAAVTELVELLRAEGLAAARRRLEAQAAAAAAANAPTA
jgi:tetratricopeptide (TPR) repeat protein